MLMFNPSKNLSRETCNWLQHRLRINGVGVPPSVFNSSSVFQRSPFIKLAYPHGNVARFYAELSPDVTDYIRDPIVLGSCYAVPVLLLDPSLLRELEGIILWEKKGQPFSSLELSSFLSPSALMIPEFVEIAEETFYALLDFVQSRAHDDDILELAERRAKVAKRHTESRFGGSIGESFPVIMACVDPLRLILPWLLKSKKDVLSNLPWSDFVAVGLGIVWVLVAYPEPQQRERVQRRKNTARHQP